MKAERPDRKKNVERGFLDCKKKIVSVRRALEGIDLLASSMQVLQFVKEKLRRSPPQLLEGGGGKLPFIQNGTDRILCLHHILMFGQSLCLVGAIHICFS